MALAVRATFIGSSTTTTTSWAPTVTAATGTAAPDIALVVFTSRGHTSGNAVATIADNSGDGVAWTNVYVTTNRKSYIWAKRLVGSHDSAVVTVSGAIDSCAGVLAYISGGGGMPQDITEETNASGDESHAGFTPSFANSLVLASIHNTGDDPVVSAQTFATIGNDGSRDHRSTGGNDSGTSLTWKLQSGGPSATGNFTWTQADSPTTTLLFDIPPNNITVTPTTLAVVTATFAPTVTATTNVVTPDPGALVLATFAPTVTAGVNVTVTPPTATLTLSTFAPTVTATGTFAQGVGGFMVIG